MAKEKLVYVLNPDGLTESIFVARGEKNEGQYRGKRFTKAGLKAEKKRIQEEALRQAEALKPQTRSAEGLKTNDGNGMAYDDYLVNSGTTPMALRPVRIHGSVSGWVGAFDKSGEMILYREFNDFKAKQDINEAIDTMNIINYNLRFYKNSQGIIVFKGEGEYQYASEITDADIRNGV